MNVVGMQVYIVQQRRFLKDFFRSWIFSRLSSPQRSYSMTPTSIATVVSRQAMILDSPVSKQYRILFEKLAVDPRCQD
jgi:hypothetical protein